MCRVIHQSILTIAVLFFACLALAACSSDGLVEPDRPQATASGSGEVSVSGRLTAGEWRDLDNWSFWLELNDGLFGVEDLEEHWGFYTEGRRTVSVVDAEGLPVVDASVALLDSSEEILWEARTDSRGEAELFPSLFGSGREGAFVAVNAGGLRRVEPVESGAGQVQVVSVEAAAPPVDVVDVMFVIDTTGSMGDELGYLQVELAGIISSVRDEHDLLVRSSVNFYRDEGEPYVVRSNAFSDNLEDAVEALRGESAAGGGDDEEALDLALEDAIFGHEWSPSARSRVLFLLLDAPPRHDIEILERIHRVAAEAARLGVRIIPIGASGTDQRAEFLLRFLDVSTGGTYVFLTGEGDTGQSHRVPSVGAHEVEPLNELLKRLLSEGLR
jgi:hypothetical protein